MKKNRSIFFRAKTWGDFFWVDTLIALFAAAVFLALSFLFAVAISPQCLESAYLYSTPTDAPLDETLCKRTDPTMLHKEPYYIERIQALQQATSRPAPRR